MITNWDEKKSLWYCGAIEQSNYPKKAVANIAQLLRKCESVIDVGAGCGALSIPIARLVKRVTAIEPSEWMYNLLLRRARKAGIKNISFYNTGWEGFRFRGNLHSSLEPHDMVICANLPENVVCNINFLRYITKISKNFIVYIQNAGGWNKFYYEDIYPMLFKKRYSYVGDYTKTYTFLYKQGIYANIKVFDYYLDQPFKDFNDALDFWRHRLKIRHMSEKERALARFLKKKLISCKRGNKLIAPFGLRRAALMWWRPW